MHTPRLLARLGQVALVLLLASNARAGVGVWSGGHGPAAENAGFVAISSGPAVWAGHAAYGLLRVSTNGGTTFVPRSAGLPTEPIVGLVRSATDANQVTLATKTRVYRSTNGGASWTLAYNPGTTINCFAGDPADPDWLYLGTSNALMLSSNGGAGWGLAPFGPYQNIKALFAWGSSVYATASTGAPLYAIGNHGTSVSPAGTGLPLGATVLAIRTDSYPWPFYAATSTGVYRSTDYGAHFAPAGAGPTGTTSLLVDAGTPSTVLAGTPTGLLKSTDSGGTWNPVAAVQGRPVASLAGSAADTWFAATTEGLRKTTDGGATFPMLSSGLMADVAEVEPDPLDLYGAYAATTAGLYKTTDDGRTWSQRLSGAVNDVLARPSGTVLAATSGGLMKSTDGGATFAAAGSGLTGGAVTLLAWDGDAFIYAATASGVFQSADEGDHFNGPGTGMANPKMLVATPMHVYAVAANHLYESTTWGASWAMTNAQPYGGERIDAIAVAPYDPTALYLGITLTEGPNVSHYLSAGSPANWFSWVANSPAVVNEILFDAIFPTSTIVVATDAGTYSTTNGGATFESFDDGLVVPGPHAVKCLRRSGRNPRKLVAGLAAGGAFTTLAVTGRNQVLNGDFPGEPNYNGWTGAMNGYIAWNPEGHSGSALLVVSEGADPVNVASQPCTPVNPNQRYELSAWVKAPQGPNQGTARVGILYFRDGACTDLFGSVGTYPVDSASWTWAFLVSLAPPPDARSAIVQLEVTRISSTFGASFDDVVFRPSIAGDANGDGTVNVVDVFYLINRLFAGGAETLGLGDVNADGKVDVLDVFYLINSLFAGGPPPVEW